MYAGPVDRIVEAGHASVLMEIRNSGLDLVFHVPYLDAPISPTFR